MQFKYLILILWTVEISWDAEEYYSKHVKRGLDKGRIKFPNPSFGEISKPVTIVDKEGRILAWYLPGLLSQEQLVSFSFLTYLRFS
jgi:hypothetical protein